MIMTLVVSSMPQVHANSIHQHANSSRFDSAVHVQNRACGLSFCPSGHDHDIGAACYYKYQRAPSMYLKPKQANRTKVPLFVFLLNVQLRGGSILACGSKLAVGWANFNLEHASCICKLRACECKRTRTCLPVVSDIVSRVYPQPV
jgi:hypothetical protein